MYKLGQLQIHERQQQQQQQLQQATKEYFQMNN